MCGIAAVVLNPNSSKTLPLTLIESARQEISPRGPSSQEYFYDPYLFAVQSTLAIQSVPTDISTVANKKFSGVLYNGELYSFPSLTNQTDTEFIQRSFLSNGARSLAFLRECSGMYSACAISSHENATHIEALVDPSGEKHLFYYFDKNLFIISSTASFVLRTLKELNIQIEFNHRSFISYLLTRHLTSCETFVKGLNLSMPGDHFFFDSHNWSFTVKKANPLDFVSPSLYSQLNALSYQEYCEYLSFSLKSALSEMLSKTSKHVNTCSVFSGGVDSSLISVYLRSLTTSNSSLYTLTFGDSDKCALRAGSLIHQLYGNTDNYHSISTDLSSYAESYFRSIHLLCSPVTTHSLPSSHILSRQVSLRSSKPCVLYGGEGADELFGGYSYYLNLLFDTSALPQQYSFNCSNDKTLDNLIHPSEISKFFRDSFDLYRSLGCTVGQSNARSSMASDYFYQCNSVGFLSSDIAGSDHGIESRSLFAHQSIIQFALSSPTKHIFGPDASNPVPKSPLNSLFVSAFKQDPLPKQGFGGFPNQLSCFNSNYMLMERFVPSSISKSLASDSRSYEWKIINSYLSYISLFPNEF
jgi:asparagine synthetase B (glutamine-hydrolysing)